MIQKLLDEKINHKLVLENILHTCKVYENVYLIKNIALCENWGNI